MRRVWMLVAGTAVALSAAATPATAAVTPRAGDTPAAGAATPRGGAVTGLSVVPATGRAEVVIAVDSAVDVQDFTLTSPSRIVLDLTGARLDMPPRFYDKVARGGVKNVRFAQYKTDADL